MPFLRNLLTTLAAGLLLFAAACASGPVANQSHQQEAVAHQQAPSAYTLGNGDRERTGLFRMGHHSPLPERTMILPEV